MDETTVRKQISKENASPWISFFAWQKIKDSYNQQYQENEKGAS